MIGVGFKETCMLLPLAIMCWDVSWKKRILWTGIGMLGCIAVKSGIDLYTDNALIGTARCQWLKVTLNIQSFADPRYRFSTFINAGTLLAFLLLPWKGRSTIAMKSIGMIFVASIMCCGNLIEYRIWFELIPFSLICLYTWQQQSTSLYRERHMDES